MLNNAKNGTVRILPGVFRERMDVNRRYLMELDTNCLLQNFYLEACIRTDRDVTEMHQGWESPTCQLRGHFLGHWLSAAAMLVAQNNDRELKAKLSAMGLFDESRKKPLPKIPSAVGVVTSPTGAAVRDIINVCTRRFPYARIRVYPALVQGDGAVDSVAAGIEYFNRCGGADVLIVGRGGGSIEDLWAFNSEKVALAVSRSRIPVISAVGHETDVTICDLVADRRAPTPSAAAELAVPETAELKQKFNNVITRETAVLMGRIDAKKKELDRLAASRVLTSPAASFEDRSVTVDRLSGRLARAQNNILEKKTALLKSGAASLSALNPMAVLSRGYGAVFAADGSVIKSVESLSVGDTVKLTLSDGDALCGIKEIELGSDNAHGKHERKGDRNE